MLLIFKLYYWIKRNLQNNSLSLLLNKYFDYYYLRSHGVDTKLGYVTLIGLPLIEKHPNAVIKIGQGVTLISRNYGNIAGVNHRVNLGALTKTAELIIEGPFGATGSSIIARERIFLGAGSGLGANSHIYDNDFHPIKLNSQEEIKTAAVEIGRNVWIAANCLILKGVIIEDEAVIGAGSVVANTTVQAKSIYGGNPAKLIKKII